MIRVLLADDQQLIREALAALLGLEVDLQIVGQVGSGDEVLGAVALLKPDVVLLDVQMPGTLLADGIEAAAALRDAGALSESGEPVRTLIVTTFGRPGYVRRALEAGASGFVVKDTGARQLAEAIRRVHAGLRVVDPSLAADSLVTGASPLTEREAQVLREAASGGTAQQIASALFCRRVRCVIICRRRWRRRVRRLVRMRCVSPRRTAGSNPLLLISFSLTPAGERRCFLASVFRLHFLLFCAPVGAYPALRAAPVEHGRMIVSMPAGAPHPFLLETDGVALGSGHHFRPVPARTRRITYAAHPECLAGYMIRRKTCGSNYRHCWPA